MLLPCDEDCRTARPTTTQRRKTELIWFGSRVNLNKISSLDLTITICSDVIQPVTTVRDLGPQLDSELSMKHHVNIIARTCFYHLRRLRQVRRRGGCEVSTTGLGADYVTP